VQDWQFVSLTEFVCADMLTLIRSRMVTGLMSCGSEKSLEKVIECIEQL
jgi:hypothetical protein